MDLARLKQFIELELLMPTTVELLDDKVQVTVAFLAINDYNEPEPVGTAVHTSLVMDLERDPGGEYEEIRNSLRSEVKDILRENGSILQ